MRLAEVNSVGALFSYCENYETSMDNYDIVKEGYELSLMEMALDLTDGTFLEADEDRKEMTDKVTEKRYNVIKRMLERLKILINKITSAINKIVRDKIFNAKVKKISTNLSKALTVKPDSTITSADKLRRLNSETEYFKFKFVDNGLVVSSVAGFAQKNISEFPEFLKLILESLNDGEKAAKDSINEWDKLVSSYNHSDGDKTAFQEAYEKGLRKSMEDANKSLISIMGEYEKIISDLNKIYGYVAPKKEK